MYTLEDGSQVNKIPANYTGWLVNEYVDKAWYQDGKLHRLDGPACEWAASDWAAGSKEWWYQEGKLHRLDGPAIEWVDGSKEWWIKGKKIHKITKLLLLMSNL
jgi:hypothetical protein